MDSEKSVNSFDLKKRISSLIICETIFFHYHCAKNNFFDIFNMIDFFSYFCYIAKCWSYDCIEVLTGSVYVKYPHQYHLSLGQYSKKIVIFFQFSISDSYEPRRGSSAHGSRRWRWRQCIGRPEQRHRSNFRSRWSNNLDRRRRTR